MLAVMVLQPTSYLQFGTTNTETVDAATSVWSCLTSNWASNNMNCNSSDVTISNPSVNVIDGCNGTSWDTTTFDLYSTVSVTAQNRYDIGFWVSNNGQSPLNGNSCTVANFTSWTNLACGDLSQGTYTSKYIGTFTVQCIDTDNNWFLNMSVITTWGTTNNNQCDTPVETANGVNGGKCSLSTNFSVPVPVGPVCTKTSTANACGGTSVTTWTLVNNVCNATTPTVPANPANYGNACTKISAANSCGATATTTGTIACDGSCNATTPVVPANPAYYGNSCSVNSDANSCGGTTTATGTLTCQNTCTAQKPATPANPAYYGNACSVNSDANSCGATTTATGTLTCQNTCTAEKPATPANPEWYGQTCTLTSENNACGASNTNTGTLTCDNLCDAAAPIAPANPERYGNVCTSEANACGETATGTVACEENSCSAETPTAEDINENQVYDCLEADVSISKSVNITSTYIWNILIYSISWQNLSAFMASGVMISDQIPTGTTFVTGSLTPTSEVAGLLTWDLGNIGAYTSGSFTIQVDTDGFEWPTTISNTATISSENDIDSENNSSTSEETDLLTPPPTPFVDMQVSKSVNTEEASVGNELTYTINYSNQGNATAENILITDTLPVGTTLLSSSPTPDSNSSWVLTWEIESLKAGNTGSITLTVWTDGMSAWEVTNTASVDVMCVQEEVEASFEEEVPPTTTTEPIVIEDEVPLTEETPVLTTCNEGETLVGDVCVPNWDPITCNEGETLVGDVCEVIATEPILCDEGQHLVGDECVSDDHVVLCDNNSDNNTDSVTTSLYEAPSIDVSITKSANTPSITVWGQITYTINYANNGNTWANGITITDELPAWVTFVSSSINTSEREGNFYYWMFEWLAPWQTGSITVVVTTTTVGTVTNVASIDSRCYNENIDSIVIFNDDNFIPTPIIVRPRVCDNNEENNSDDAVVSVTQWWSFGWGFVPPGLLDTGGPLGLLDTWAPQWSTEKVTRWQVAKMLTDYYKNILKLSITRKDTCNPKNYGDYNKMSKTIRESIWDACSLWLMGLKNDRKSLLKLFRPSDYMTKWEFAAVLSRMLYNTDWKDNGKFRYSAHIFLLKHYKVVNGTIKAYEFETKWNVEKLLKLKTK